MSGTQVLCAKAGYDGLGRCPVGYRLYAAKEAAFLDDEFADDCGGNALGHVP